jgi:hypothetical protein
LLRVNNSQSSSDEEQNADIVQLFASEEELDENAERPNTRSVANNSLPVPAPGQVKVRGKTRKAKDP